MKGIENMTIPQMIDKILHFSSPLKPVSVFHEIKIRYGIRTSLGTVQGTMSRMRSEGRIIRAGAGHYAHNGWTPSSPRRRGPVLTGSAAFGRKYDPEIMRLQMEEDTRLGLNLKRKKKMEYSPMRQKEEDRKERKRLKALNTSDITLNQPTTLTGGAGDGVEESEFTIDESVDPFS